MVSSSHGGCPLSISYNIEQRNWTVDASAQCSISGKAFPVYKQFSQLIICIKLGSAVHKVQRIQNFMKGSGSHQIRYLPINWLMSKLGSFKQSLSRSCRDSHNINAECTFVAHQTTNRQSTIYEGALRFQRRITLGLEEKYSGI